MGAGAVRDRGRDPWPGSWIEDLKDAGYYCVNIGKMHTAPWDKPCGFHERYIVENKDRFRADRWYFDEWGRALRIKGARKLLFLQIGFPGPHPPFDPVQSCIDRYADRGLPIVDATPESIERQRQGLRRLRELMLERNPDAVKHLPDPTREQRRRQRAYYLANVSMIDTRIGDSFGDHGHSQKWNRYEESTHVPAIYRSPKRFAGPKRVDELVELFDIGPTILQMAGVETPEWMEARSLLPLLEGAPGACGRAAEEPPVIGAARVARAEQPEDPALARLRTTRSCAQ